MILGRQLFFSNVDVVVANGPVKHLTKPAVTAPLTTASMGKAVFWITTDVTTCTGAIQGRWSSDDPWQTIATFDQTQDGLLVDDFLPQMRVNISALASSGGAGVTVAMFYPRSENV